MDITPNVMLVRAQTSHSATITGTPVSPAIFLASSPDFAAAGPQIIVAATFVGGAAETVLPVMIQGSATLNYTPVGYTSPIMSLTVANPVGLLPLSHALDPATGLPWLTYRAVVNPPVTPPTNYDITSRIGWK